MSYTFFLSNLPPSQPKNSWPERVLQKATPWTIISVFSDLEEATGCGELEGKVGEFWRNLKSDNIRS